MKFTDGQTVTTKSGRVGVVLGYSTGGKVKVALNMESKRPAYFPEAELTLYGAKGATGDIHFTSNGVLDRQVGGDHYKKLGDYQPWQVLKHWLTPEEFRGYMKGSAIAYLARELDKGGLEDVAKAAHTLDALVEMAKA